MSLLFTPLSLRSVEFKNRVWMPPMCQYSAENGMPTDWHRTHYGARAAGGVGMVILEATAVSPVGRISPFDLGLWNDEQTKAFSHLAKIIKDQGAIPAIQLAHAGRKGSTGASGAPLPAGDPLAWQTLAPSAIPFKSDFGTPKAMDERDMEAVVEQFVSTAGRALSGGFQVVEIHMAHGYLLHQFLSPLTNKRTDDFGGSLENRMRFPLRVAEAVRKAWPQDLPVFVRVSATDWVEGGWDLPQTIELCEALKRVGIDLIDCSTGGLVPDAKIPVAPGYQLPFAEAVREQTRLPVAAVGLITEAQQANAILTEGKADAVLLGRELLRNPHLPLYAARQLGDIVKWPRQYERAKV